MRIKKRKDERYKIIGRVRCDELSPLGGSLIDVSLHGCQFYYTVPVTVSIEDDYNILIQASESEGYDISLICRPVWVNEDSGKTYIGMSVLRSPDSEKFNKYIEHLGKEHDVESEYKSQIVDSQCQFL